MFKFGLYPLRLRFIEGEGEGAGTEPVEGQQEAVPEATPEQKEAPKGNPAFESIRSQLDPISYSRIEGELKKFDQSAQQRVQASNEALKPWKAFADQGITPDAVQNALRISHSLDENPAEVYKYLGDFLQQTGRMPTNAEVKAASDAGEIGNDPENPQTDPRIDELAEQQEQMRQFLANQQQQAVQHEADVALDNEISAFKTAHPDVTAADVQEILGRAAFVAQQNLSAGKQEIPSLEEVYTGWFSDLRNRFLSTPRPGDSAPKLLPTSGGMPSNAPAVGLGQMSRQQVQDFIAAGLQQGSGS